MQGLGLPAMVVLLCLFLCGFCLGRWSWWLTIFPAPLCMMFCFVCRLIVLPVLSFSCFLCLGCALDSG